MFTKLAKWAASGRTMASSPVVYEEISSCRNQQISILRRDAGISIRTKAYVVNLT
jgi:hypothetical protein